jgi:quinol monooxygenase YgiN
VQARLISLAPISPRLLTAAQAMCRATRTEPGCIDYRIGVDVEHHNILLLSEKWRNEAALVAHFGTPHMADFRAALRAEGEIKTEIDVRGVSAPRSLDFSGGQVRIAG